MQQQSYPLNEIAELRASLVDILNDHAKIGPMLKNGGVDFPAHQWIAFAAGHLITAMRIELADEQTPTMRITDLPLTEAGRKRITTVFPRIISEAHTMWKYLSLHFHECQLKLCVHEEIPPME